MPFFLPLVWFSGASFMAFGAGTLFTPYMEPDFQRFGLEEFRRLTGALELAGGVGLVLGLRAPILGALAAGGLALLMLVGFVVRLKFGDGLIRSLPALFYVALNLYLLRGFLKGPWRAMGL